MVILDIIAERDALTARVAELEAQLAERDAEIECEENRFNQLFDDFDKVTKQLAEHKKIIALAREAISYALRKDYNCNGITCTKKLEEALAAIDDSEIIKGLVLCDSEPLTHVIGKDGRVGEL